MIEDIAVFIRSDMGVEQPEFAIFEQPISVLEVGPPGAHRGFPRDGGGPHVDGNLDGDGSGCAGHERVECSLHGPGRVGGRPHDFDVLGDLGQHARLVVELVQDAVPAAELERGDLAADGQDAGAYALICPMVNTRADAERLVAVTHYAPRGTRSFGPIRALLYGGTDYPKHANDTIVVFAMIETKQALDNLDDIMSVKGLDAVYIGPSDLSLALGCTPTFDDVDPPVVEAIDHILARADLVPTPVRAVE